MEGQSYLGIKQRAEEDRPREKFLKQGKKTLTNMELLAIILGSGTRRRSALDVSQSLLEKYHHRLSELAQATAHQLMQIRGIGGVRAITILAALELGKRCSDQPIEKRPIITQSEDAYRLVRTEIEDLPFEEFHIIVMNRANRVLGKHRVSKGGISTTVVDPRVVFKVAIEHTASSIILVHNHPSGQCYPSKMDKDITVKMVHAGNLLDVKVLDHLIVTSQDYFSFADAGWMGRIYQGKPLDDLALAK